MRHSYSYLLQKATSLSSHLWVTFAWVPYHGNELCFGELSVRYSRCRIGGGGGGGGISRKQSRML